MSVFKVKLNNPQQGTLDVNPTGAVDMGNGVDFFPGSEFSPSKQRQVYVMGPKKINRLLKDGDTFTDCNYWKQFAYPQTSYEKAFIEVVTDDGSVYSDIADENTYGVGGTYTLDTNLADTVIDFVNGTQTASSVTTAIASSGPAKFLQVTNTHATIGLTGELNGNTNLTFTLAAGQSQIFNSGDLMITMLRLKSATAGGTCFVIASVQAAINS